MRRGNVESYLFVIAREGGRSSIPEASMLELRGGSILDAPPSRGMTAIWVADVGEICVPRMLRSTPPMAWCAADPGSMLLVGPGSCGAARRGAAPRPGHGSEKRRLTLPSSVPSTSDRGDPACPSFDGAGRRYCRLRAEAPEPSRPRWWRSRPCAAARTA